MKKGVLIAVILVCALSALAGAFDVEVSPGSISADVQAGGYVAELVEIHAAGPVQVLASASPSIRGMLKLTRHNDTAVLVHILPPIDSGEIETKGVLQLDVQGQNPVVSASLQHVAVPLNITISVRGRAERAAQVALPAGQVIEIVPLSGDAFTVLIVAIAGIVLLNVMLRSRRKR